MTTSTRLAPLVRTLGLLATLASLSFSSGATIVSGSVNTVSGSGAASFVKLGVPLDNRAYSSQCAANTVGADCFESRNLFGFDERQNITLASSGLLVNDIGAGVAGALSAGTTVASHYIFFDPQGITRITGTVQFDAPILGLIFMSADLATSDILANTSVNYLNPNLRGLEAGDTVSFSGRQLTLDLTASSPGDYVRVLTGPSSSAVPEPGGLALVGLALAGLLAVRRRA